jgi:hypothetical protein
MLRLRRQKDALSGYIKRRREEEQKEKEFFLGKRRQEAAEKHENPSKPACHAGRLFLHLS